MLFVVRFFDDPDRLYVRGEHMAAHLAWLDERKSAVLVAGSLRPAENANPVGACWIVEAASVADVESLLQSDPFLVHGLRKSYEILMWFKAFPERKTLV